MAKDGIKDRKFQGILYPDSESYCCDDVLNVLKSTFPEFAYILHDKDTDENGELKKTSYPLGGTAESSPLPCGAGGRSQYSGKYDRALPQL